MKSKLINWLFLVSFLSFSCQSISTEDNAPQLQFVAEVSNSNPLYIDLSEVVPQFDSIEITIEKDAVFKREKRYKAYDVHSIIEGHIKKNQLDTTGIELVLICKDGYKPSIPLSSIYQENAYLAFKDMELEDKNWEDEAKFAPYYLVWEDGRRNRKGSAWPYGLIAIELVQHKDLFAAAYPNEEPKMQQGFELFKQYCMKCHSVNKAGGDMGPELNYPKNITEYWTREDLLAFIQTPSSYRYNSKMPPMQYLEMAQIEQIVDYLAYMKDWKVEEDRALDN